MGPLLVVVAGATTAQKSQAAALGSMKSVAPPLVNPPGREALRAVVSRYFPPAAHRVSQPEKYSQA